MDEPAVALDVERAELDAVGPLGCRVVVGEVDDHPEAAANVVEAASCEQVRRAVIPDEVRALEDDALALGPVRLELARPPLEEVEDEPADPAAGELRMNVRVADEPALPPLEEVRDARQPAVDADEPRVLLEVETVPVLTELALGPVRVAVDGDVGCLEQRQRLVEPVRCGAFRPARR